MGVVVSVAAAAWLAFYLVPVISIGEESIRYAEFLKVQGALEAFDRLSRAPEKQKQDIQTHALMNLIEQRFLDILIKKTDPMIAQAATEAVGRAIIQTIEAQDVTLEEAAQYLYGLSAADFKRLVLLPQAKRDLLEQHFGGMTQELQNEWEELYRTVHIKIYYPGFSWKDGEIQIKK